MNINKLSIGQSVDFYPILRSFQIGRGKIIRFGTEETRDPLSATGWRSTGNKGIVIDWNNTEWFVLPEDVIADATPK